MKRLIFAAVFLFSIASISQAADLSGIYSFKKDGIDADVFVTKTLAQSYAIELVATNDRASIGEVRFLEFAKTVEKSGKAFYSKEDSCMISFSFTGNSIVVKQDTNKGNCDAGEGIYFSGTYKKKSK